MSAPRGSQGTRFEDLARAIFGERAAAYVQSASHRDPEVLARLHDLARPQAGWRALDVATGAGHTAFALAPSVRSVVAVDLTPEMLREAEGLGRTLGIRNVEFRVADVHALPFADGAFDLVTSRRAPHHFSDIGQALAEMRRVLRPGGRLVIDDRSAPEDDEADGILHRLDRLHDASHVRQYRPSAWRRMLADAGFAVETSEPYTRLRSIRHMKGGVSPEDCARIDALMAALTPAQRRTLGVQMRDGDLHHLHFYILLSASRA